MIQLTLVQWLLLAGSLILLLSLVLQKTYNTIILKRNQVKTDLADVDVQLKRRSGLIDNLVLLVKDYAKHEKDTFQEVARARAAIDTSKTVGESAAADSMLSKTLRSLFMVVESYPKLQASENYKQLRDDLSQSENLIADYREAYNLSVQDYNTYIQLFPNLLAASLFGFGDEPLFTAREVSVVKK